MPGERWAQHQAIQAADYHRPHHWRLGAVDDRCYVRKSTHLAELIGAALAGRTEQVGILDVGCGDGRGTWELIRLLRLRWTQVTAIGVDIEGNAIRWAKEQTENHGGDLDFVQGDLDAALPKARALPGPTVAVYREVIEHLPEEEIDRQFRLLRRIFEDMLLVVTVPSTNSPVEPKHFRHYDSAMLLRTLERNGFEATALTGFGWRPRALCWPMQKIKGALNRIRRLAPLMDPCWRNVPPGTAITLLALAQPQSVHKP